LRNTVPIMVLKTFLASIDTVFERFRPSKSTGGSPG